MCTVTINTMEKIIYIAVGGGIGAVLRYLVGASAWLRMPNGFPLGTLVVNLLGCLLIGMVFARFAADHRWVHPLIMVGLLGGFTTFSTFGLESFQLYKNEWWLSLVTYVLISNIAGIALVFTGIRLGEIMK